ncbi:MAG: TrbI/VirB10 family protein [Pseudomonadales bacterium]
MAEPPAAPGAAPVSDLRPVPRGVMPRGFQTWLMVGLAAGIVLIILLAGEPEPPGPSVTTSAAPAAPNPDRLRDYQERLKAMEARQALEAQAAAAVPPYPVEPRYEEPTAPAVEDPIVADRKRREYESLFASNVVSSRRPEAERPQAEASRPSTGPTRAATDASLDEIAAAVVRATGGAAPSSQVLPVGSPPSPAAAQGAAGLRDGERHTPERTGPLSAAGPLHTLLEGTVIDTVLTNRLDGNGVAPVNCLVTNPIYSHSGQHVVIPAGARILGETRPVQALGETRLAVSFHRLLMPDGSTQRLDQFLGLNQIGDAGLRDKVNQHFLATFGAAGAVGLISGLAQWLGTAGLTGGTGERTVIIAGGAADSASQASLQVMNRFLNRLPTITIREGHRVKVYLTSDLQLPAYQPSALAVSTRR